MKKGLPHESTEEARRQKAGESVEVIYKTPSGVIRLSLRGDPGEICNAVAEKLGLVVNRGHDAKFLKAMEGLKK